MNCLRAINICWWKHAIVVWVTSYTSEEFWLNDAVQWDKGATWSFCWKMNLDGSFLIISQLASESYGLACWTLSKLLPRFPAESVPTEKLPFAKERPSTSWHTTRANSAGFLKQFLSKLCHQSILPNIIIETGGHRPHATQHVPTLHDSWKCLTSINSSACNYLDWLFLNHS